VAADEVDAASGAAIEAPATEGLAETSGYIGVRAVQHQGNAGRDADRQSAMAMLRGRIRFSDALFVFQLRPMLVHSEDSPQAQGRVDEMYWENKVSSSSFIFFGRRRIVNGLAVGRNPTDFFNQKKVEDRTLDDEDRRAEKIGDDMAGWTYFGAAGSLQAIVATPERAGSATRAMLQLSGKSDALAADYSASLYYADVPGAGLNFSAVMGEHTTVYAEAAWRRGRDRDTPVISAAGMVVGRAGEPRRWVSDIVVGGQYTMQSGVNVNAEYWRNDNGYAEGEYAPIVQAISGRRMDGQLASSFVAVPALRKNSLFLRISDIYIAPAVMLETTAIVSLDDHSRFMRGAFAWEVSKTDRVRVGVDRFSGTSLSEYGINPTHWRSFLTYKRFF
jgi:hypothetical protein